MVLVLHSYQGLQLEALRTSKAAKRIPIGEFAASRLTAIPLNPIANDEP